MTDPKALTAERDRLSVLEWAVDRAHENLRRVETLRADEECGPSTVEQARNWLNLCKQVLSKAERATREQTASTGDPVAEIRQWNDGQLDSGSYVYWFDGFPTHLPIGAKLYAAPVEQAGSPEPKALLACAMQLANALANGGRLLSVPLAEKALAAAQASLAGHPIEQAGSTPDETLREAALAEFESYQPDAEGNLGAFENGWNECLRRVRALATPTKPEMQPEGLVSSCQALSETAGESAEKRDAERYRYLRRKGACHSKRVGLAIGTPLKALMAFRYWIEPDALDMLITAAIHAAPAERDSEGPSLLPVDPGQDEQGKGESQ